MWGVSSLKNGAKGIHGGLGTGPVRFAEAFKHWRHEGAEGTGDSTMRLIPNTDTWRRIGGGGGEPSKAAAPGASPSGLFATGPEARGYHLIRSDVEDDNDWRRASKTLPGMPHMDPIMRQRTFKELVVRGVDKADAKKGLFDWINDQAFQYTSVFAIVANAAVVGFETELTDSPPLFFAEQVLLVFFCVELALRIAHHRLKFFCHDEDIMWNMFDTSVVLVGIFDQWAAPALRSAEILPKDEDSAKHNTLLLTFSMLKYLRIIRLFRLVRIIKPLHLLAQGVVEALQGMFWVLVFVVMTLYSMAILCTRMIGHGDILSEDMKAEPDIQQIQNMFLSVGDSMFTLFGTISSWTLIRFVPLFEESPMFKPIFVCFYVYAAWGLLAVMTGVVSENMIAIREQVVKEDEEREAMRKTMITNMLLEVFREADADHSGAVSRAEFETMVRSEKLLHKLTKNSHLKVQDLQDLFDWLDHDGGGTVTIDEFMTGFKWVNEPLRAKSLVKLQERLLKDLYALERQTAGSVEQRVDQVHKLVSQPLRKVHAITEQMQSLDVQFSRLRTTLQGQADNTPAAEQVADVEVRLLAKVNLAIKTLDGLSVKDRAKKPRE